MTLQAGSRVRGEKNGKQFTVNPQTPKQQYTIAYQFTRMYGTDSDIIYKYCKQYGISSEIIAMASISYHLTINPGSKHYSKLPDTANKCKVCCKPSKTLDHEVCSHCMILASQALINAADDLRNNAAVLYRSLPDSASYAQAKYTSDLFRDCSQHLRDIIALHATYEVK